MREGITRFARIDRGWNVRGFGGTLGAGLAMRAFGVLGARAARMAAVAVAIVLGVGLVAGTIRVLPWIASPAVPGRVALPFVRGLVAVALETALLAGPPLGFALATAVFVERGEARGLFAIGVSPSRIVRSTLPPALAFAALAALAAAAWGTDAAAPGRLARSLVAEARAACEASPARAAFVPLVRASWLCFPHAPARLVGAMPGAAETPFTASSLWVSDDLGTVSVEDLHLSLGGSFATRVHAGRARVTGLPPWARASNLRPALRALLLSSTGALLALLASFAVLRSSRSGRAAALALGAAGPVTALAVLAALERTENAPRAYALVPLAAALALFACDLLVTLVLAARRRSARRSPRAPG